MFYNLFTELRSAKIPVTLKEYLVLLEGLEKNIPDYSVDDFYYLARTTLVKDERSWTYRQLRDEAVRYGHWVHQRLEKGTAGAPRQVPSSWGIASRWRRPPRPSASSSMGWK